MRTSNYERRPLEKHPSQLYFPQRQANGQRQTDIQKGFIFSTTAHKYQHEERGRCGMLKMDRSKSVWPTTTIITQNPSATKQPHFARNDERTTLLRLRLRRCRNSRIIIRTKHWYLYLVCMLSVYLYTCFYVQTYVYIVCFYGVWRCWSGCRRVEGSVADDGCCVANEWIYSILAQCVCQHLCYINIYTT